MTEQFNEGFKETLFSLLASAVITQDSHILANIFRAYELKSAQQQIEALQQVKKADPEIAPQADKAIQQIKKKEQPAPPKAVPVPVSTKEQVLDKAAKVIMPKEIFGTDLDAPRNVELRKPHPDSKGKWTLGVGHLLGYGREKDRDAWYAQRKKEGKPPVLSKQEMINLFRSDLEKHYNLVSSTLGNKWDTLSDDLKIALIDACYVGDFIPKDLEKRIKERRKNPNISLNLKFVDHILKGDFDKAAKEYLVHDEYRTTLKKNPSSGMIKRMNRNAEIIKNEGLKKARK